MILWRDEGTRPGGMTPFGRCAKEWVQRPSATTTHGVTAFQKFQHGKGDVVREFVEAFRARGLKVGFYYCAPGNYDGQAGNTLPPGKPSLHGMPPEAAGDYVGFMVNPLADLPLCQNLVP